jgi:hypothetical protein
MKLCVLGSLEENVQAEAEEEEEEEVEVEQGETVLLFPRLVLERIRLTPSTRPSSRRQSEDSSNRAPSPVQGSSTIPQQAPDTPRSRESFEGLNSVKKKIFILGDKNEHILVYKLKFHYCKCVTAGVG